MSDKSPDPNLSAPQEANTTKHINFTEIEEDNATDNTTEDTDVFDNATRRAWKELREEEDQNK